MSKTEESPTEQPSPQASDSTREPPKQTFRSISFWSLVLAAAAMGLLFFKIIQPFFAPLFFAAVLAILFHPLHHKATNTFGGRYRWAAIVTVVLLFFGLSILSMILFLASRELIAAGQDLAQFEFGDHPVVQKANDIARTYLPGVDWTQFRESIATGFESAITDLVKRTGNFLTNAVQLVIGIAIMGVALYYFLAEGSSIVRALQAVSPLEDRDEWLLFNRFAVISRGVVVGLFVYAFVQAILLGVGMAIAGIERVWMLTGLTFLLSMIPFVGAAGVWVPVSVWLMWDGQYLAGILLALYGVAIVSTSDNLIRAQVLHESAQLHPLLALISALGALQVFGLWGIFLGPVAAAFFYSILKILHDRLQNQSPST